MRRALIGLLAAGSVACNGSQPEAAAANPGAALAPSGGPTTAAAPTEERLVERVRAMWGKKTFDHHQYENPVVREVMKLDQDAAHVRVSMRWTPSHPQLAKVQFEPGQTLTQDVDTVETWRWTDGDWYFVEAKSIEEFVEQNPDVLKKGAQPPAEGETPKGAVVPVPHADEVAEGNQPK